MTIFRYSFCIILLLNSFFSHAQTAEKLEVHFDKPFYVGGEDVWYKIYFQSESKAIQSKVIRVEWVDSNGEILLQQKLPIVDNYAIGDLAIPYDWEEGNYLFRAYTLWALNFGDNQYFQQVIPIYNLLETPRIAEQPIEKEPIQSKQTTNSSNLKINLTTNKSTYQKREIVELLIELTDKEGNPIDGHLSIAVSDRNYWKSEEITTNYNLVSSTTNSFTGKYKTESGLSLNGLLKDKDGNLLDTRFLSIYFPATKKFEKATVTNGKLSLSIPAFKSTQPIQFFDLNPFHDPIPTFKLDKINIKTPYQGKPLFRTEVVANYLFLLSQYRQYREVFNSPTPDYKTDYTFQKINWETDKSWSMEKYTGLSDLASFAAEIISDARVVGKGKERSIRLQYEEKSIYNRRSPWYLVNDWLTEDEATVLKMPFREIEKIAMFNSKKSIVNHLDPAMVSRGLLVIQTKDGKTPDAIIKRPNNLELIGFYPSRTFPKEDTREKNIPDFRPLIYWNPNIQTDENGVAKVRFTTSDAIGKRAIKVVASSKEGQISQQQLIYRVNFD